MSEQNPEGLALPDQDAGALFRSEMAVTNFFLGAWKQLLAVVALGLVMALVYGQYQTWYRGQQRATSSEIADVMRKLPAIADPTKMDDETRTKLVAAGASLEGIGAKSVPPANVEAYLQAAELYRRLDLKDEQRRALLGAAPSAEGPLRYAVDGALANLDLEQGNGDAAVERLRELSANVDGFLAQQASLDLGLALEHLGRADEAIVVYTDFAKKHKNSLLIDEVTARKEALAPTPEEIELAPEPQ